MNPITGFGPLDTLASLAATPLAGSAGATGASGASGAYGARSPGAWFDGATAGSAAALRAEVEPGAAGLGVQQHAERVLAQLLAEPAPAA